MLTNIPNLITLLRIALIPFVVSVFYWDTPFGFWVATGLFVLACVSDFLDGYLARTLNQESSFGSFLDPLADKLLVASVLVMLVGFDRITGFSLIPTIIILCREILVSGLREYLGKMQGSLPVSYMAKWKTTFQMGALGCLIMADPETPFAFLAYVGLTGLWVAAFLTLATGYEYLKMAFAQMDLGSKNRY